MSERRDLVVIGGGPNGLATAIAVARAGQSVLVVERRPEVGGLASGEEFQPGYRTDGVLLDTAAVRPWVLDELKLGGHGLVRHAPPPMLVPKLGGAGLVLDREEVQGVSDRDRGRYGEYRDFLARVAPVFRRWLDRPPPDLLDPGPADLLGLGLTGFALRRLGRGTMSEVLRGAPTAVADWLGEWFEDEGLRAALAAPALWASRTGPRAPGTTANLLLAAATAGDVVAGGPAGLIAALERAARAAGVEIRTSCEVEAIAMSGAAAVGVRLAGGEEIAARRVAASCDPKQVFLRLVPPLARSRGLTEDVLGYRARGSSAKVDLALSAYPDFDGRPGERFESIRIGETLEELERAADAVKYRSFSERPLLEIRVPTIAVPELAPSGHHVFSILVHFAPHDLDGEWGDVSRDALGRAVVDRLTEVAPAARDLVVGRRVLTPVDLEERFGLTGGHLYHGEHALDQLLVRPVPGCARYETPITGLFLCGSGSHPGGGLTCAPGALAAKAVLSSLP